MNERLLKKALCICCLLLAVNCYSQNETNYIMSNYDFTNRNSITKEQMIKYFGDTYSKSDLSFAWEVFVSKGLSPLLFKLVAEKEGMPLNNYHLGCGIHLNRTWYKAFRPQVWACATTLRYWYDYAPNDHWWVYIRERGQKVVMWNSATYSLYKYTPHYKIYLNQTKQHHGNYIVRKMWINLKKRVGL